MNAIHFNVEAVEAFCSQLQARRENLSERMRDEQALYEAVFDGWRDHRAQGVQQRLEELSQTTRNIASDIDDLVVALRQQVQRAEEYLRGSESW